jgi:hypothetical protein
MPFRKKKFRTLVHYVCDKCSEQPSKLGATKLHKVAWHADMIAYLQTGETITGETYVKRQFGPTAKHMLPTLDDLEKAGAIAVRDVDYFGYDKTEYVSLKKPDIGDFSAQEIDIVNDMIRYVCDENSAASISAKTHDRIWELAEIGEEIPFGTAFAGNPGEVTADSLKWATREIERLDLAETPTRS